MKEIYWECSKDTSHNFKTAYTTNTITCETCQYPVINRTIIYICDNPHCRKKTERSAPDWYVISMSLAQFNKTGGAYRMLDQYRTYLNSEGMEVTQPLLIYNVNFCSDKCTKAWFNDLCEKNFVLESFGDRL